MIEFFIEPFSQYAFMRRALLACLAIAVGMSPIGVFLILRRMSLIADSMSHSIFPGVALGYSIFGFSATAMGIGGLLAGLSVAILTTVATRFSIIKEDTNLATLHVAALALGIILVALNGNGFDLLDFLIGNVLTLDNTTLLVLILGSIVAFFLLTILFRPLVIDTLDPSYLSSQGVQVGMIRSLFLCIVAIGLTSGFLAIGPLMIGGLMIIPAGAARLLCKNLEHTLLCSMVIALFSGYVGLLLSFHLNVPSTASIILSAFFCYVVALFYAIYKEKFIFKNKKHYTT